MVGTCSLGEPPSGQAWNFRRKGKPRSFSKYAKNALDRLLEKNPLTAFRSGIRHRQYGQEVTQTSLLTRVL
ncbi:hypothetical protein R1flu_009263 [Riccia fluitans]|uniref:Uncharacterized protein n=1 Tax=Riccia fluitans TaxID=41844 RepID=A0ABD1Z1L4_9MARC